MALFDSNNDGENELAPRGSMVGGGVSSARGASLCGTLKTLLMASTYRVRSATARLIASFCGDDSSRMMHEDPSHESAASMNRFGRFIREKIIAAGTTGKHVRGPGVVITYRIRCILWSLTTIR